MLTKIIGIAAIALGIFMLIGAPGDRVQLTAYGNTGRLAGLGIAAVGVVLLIV